MQKRILTFVGILLPSFWAGMTVVLVLVSFISNRVSSAIAAENLILLTLIFSPVLYITGITISIITLVTSKMRKIPVLAAGLNIALLACWLYFKKSFLMEFELIG